MTHMRVYHVAQAIHCQSSLIVKGAHGLGFTTIRTASSRIEPLFASTLVNNMFGWGFEAQVTLIGGKGYLLDPSNDRLNNVGRCCDIAPLHSYTDGGRYMVIADIGMLPRTAERKERWYKLARLSDGSQIHAPLDRLGNLY